jgi:hypothetical protein
VISIKGRAGSSGKRARVRGNGAAARLQLGAPGVVRVNFSRKQAKRVRKAMAAGRKAVARITISATGGGGGTDSAKRRVKQRR